MSAKAIVTRAVILAALGGWTGRAVAQLPPSYGSTANPEQLPAPTAPTTSPLPAVMPPPSQIPAIQAGLPSGSVPDPWITYDRPGCCGPIGADGPIDTELYIRSGPSITTGNSIIQRTVNTGWAEEFGGRSVFFNRDTTAAWTADIGIDYTYDNGGGSGHNFTLFQPFSINTSTNVFQQVTQVVPVPLTVSIRDYQRVAFRPSFGGEWYIGRPAYCPGTHWRVGTDIGGRWGSSRIGLNDFTQPNIVIYRRLSDVYGSVVLAIHSDVEVPVGPRTWFAGRGAGRMGLQLERHPEGRVPAAERATRRKSTCSSTSASGFSRADQAAIPRRPPATSAITSAARRQAPGRPTRSRNSAICARTRAAAAGSVSQVSSGRAASAEGSPLVRNSGNNSRPASRFTRLM